LTLLLIASSLIDTFILKINYSINNSIKTESNFSIFNSTIF